PGQGGDRRVAPEGDSRGRRARHLRQRPPRLAARDRCGRGLHQDLDRQAVLFGDAASDARDARGDPRCLRGDRPASGHEAGRRASPGGARLGSPLHAEEGGGSRWNHEFPPAQPRLLHDRLMAELEQRGDRTPAPSKWDYASAPESREIVTLEERYGLFVGGEFVEPRSGDYYETIAPASEEPLAAIPQA